jgi:hypothetical protein
VNNIEIQIDENTSRIMEINHELERLYDKQDELHAKISQLQLDRHELCNLNRWLRREKENKNG